jgi:hypothetical protein
MKYFLVLSIFLVGCSTTSVPVKRTFPAADPVMFEPATPLKQLPPDTKDLDQLITNSVENFGEYRKLVKKLEMWQEWYIKQKENFDKVQ